MTNISNNTNFDAKNLQMMLTLIFQALLLIDY